MKKKFYLLAVLFTSLIVSCSDDDDPIPAPVVVTPEVVIPDTGAPTITLVGSSTINIEEGDSYTDAGASASDEVDGDISSSITTSGYVDTSKPGTYTLTYSVTDAAGNSSESTRIVIVACVITELKATGSVAEQSPIEAKKTIYGKWDLKNSSNAASKSNECEFDFIEFNDEDYIMSLLIGGETTTVFGAFVLNEDAAGNVSSVELKFNLGTSDITIATLTNIVVVESGDNLSATFDVVLDIPEEADFDVCNSLSGSYEEVGKEEPMPESVEATANSDHAKLIKTWTLSSIIVGGNNMTSDELSEPCKIESPVDGEEDIIKEGCSNANSLSLSISAFGTYSMVWIGSSEGTYVEVNAWQWVDTNYNSIYTGNDQELIQIVSLTDTEAVFSATDGGNEAVYTFTAQ